MTHLAPFLIGPLVILAGVVAFAMMLRGRSRQQESLYSTVRSERERKVREMQKRALAAQRKATAQWVTAENVTTAEPVLAEPAAAVALEVQPAVDAMPALQPVELEPEAPEAVPEPVQPLAVEPLAAEVQEPATVADSTPHAPSWATDAGAGDAEAEGPEPAVTEPVAPMPLAAEAMAPEPIAAAAEPGPPAVVPEPAPAPAPAKSPLPAIGRFKGLLARTAARAETNEQPIAPTRASEPAAAATPEPEAAWTAPTTPTEPSAARQEELEPVAPLHAEAASPFSADEPGQAEPAALIEPELEAAEPAAERAGAPAWEIVRRDSIDAAAQPTPETPTSPARGAGLLAGARGLFAKRASRTEADVPAAMPGPAPEGEQAKRAEWEVAPTPANAAAATRPQPGRAFWELPVAEAEPGPQLVRVPSADPEGDAAEPGEAKLSLAQNLLSYAGLAAALLVVALGVVLMFGASR